MKAYFSLIKNASAKIISSRSLLFGFCTKNQAQMIDFTKAIFSNNISAVSLDPNSSQFKRYSLIFEANRQGDNINSYEWVNEVGIQTLCNVLQLLANLTLKHKRHIIDAKSYIKLLQSYYSHFGLLDQQKIVNRIINPTIKLQYILPSFIHTENPQVLQMLKMKQFNLLQLICKSKRVTLDEFIRIMSPNIYNITDLPLINKYFYLYFYPQFLQVQTPRKLMKCLSYLCRFDAITVLLLQKSIEILKIQLKAIPSSFQEPLAQLSAYLQISNCISLLVLKAYNTLKRTPQEVQLSIIHQQLSSRSITINGNKFTISQLQDQQNLSNLTKHLSNIICLDINSYLSQLDSKKNDHQKMPNMISNAVSRQVQMLRLCDKNKVVQMIKLQLMPTIIKFILAQIHIKPNLTHSAQAFLNSQRMISFCQKYPCYPDLHKDLLITMDMHPSLFTNIQSLATSIGLFRIAANNFLNQTIKQIENDRIQHYYSPKFASNLFISQGWLWDLYGQALSNRILEIDQDYSYGNLLGMLKEDSNFLQSRMGLNEAQVIKRAITTNTIKSQWNVDVWDYPHHFVIVKKSPLNSEQQTKLVIFNRFTKELFFPKGIKPQRPQLIYNMLHKKIGINRQK